MPLPSRELIITYGSVTLGGTSSKFFLDAPLRFSISADKAAVEADVIVFGTSEAGFAANCAELETAFRTPRQDLEVKFGSAVHESFSGSAYTGFNMSPSIAKGGDINSDTGRSRRYKIAVAVDLPADYYTDHAGVTTNNRRTANVNLYTTDAGRRRLMVTGTYTASTANSRGARAQYNANITTYLGDLVTAFGGTWETASAPLDPQVATDDMDTVCHFSVTLEELIFDQLEGVTDSPLLRRQHISITRSADLSGDSIVFGIKPQKLQRITIDYSTAVLVSQSTDLKTVWDSTVKPYLTTLARRISNSNSGFIESEIPSFDPVENRITARLTYVSPPGSKLLSARITTDESESTGVTLIPVWNGDRMAKQPFVGPGAITRTVTILTTEVGLPGDPSVVGSGGALDIIGGNPPPGGGGGFANAETDITSILSENAGGNAARNAGLANAGGVAEPTTSPDGGNLSRVFLGVVHSHTPRRIGPIDGEPLDVVDRMVVARYEYFVRPKSIA